MLKPFIFQEDDVSAEDLGGKLIAVAMLSDQDVELFRRFIPVADKAAAHFTLEIDHPWERTHETILRVHHYLSVNVYEPVGKTIIVAGLGRLLLKAVSRVR